MNTSTSGSLLSEEQSILDQLDRVVRPDPVRQRIDSIVRCVEERMREDRTRLMAWEPIPLSVYGQALPPMIRSSWIFILRAGATTGAERHPNSRQRMMSYRGSGDLQTGGEGQWESHLLVSEPTAGFERRWVSIPANVWHQAVVPPQDWVVVSFHTVAADELIEERPDLAESTATHQKHYLSLGGTRLREFRGSDLALVRRRIRHTIEVCYSGVYPPRAVEFFKQFHSEEEILARSETGTVLVAEREGTVVATGALVGCEILGVFVDPQCQGRGYGKALMGALEDRAMRNGCKEVELSVSLPSKGFYESLGYRIIEECSIAVGEGECLRFWKAKRSLGTHRGQL